MYIFPSEFYRLYKCRGAGGGGLGVACFTPTLTLPAPFLLTLLFFRDNSKIFCHWLFLIPILFSSDKRHFQIHDTPTLINHMVKVPIYSVYMIIYQNT